jgi:hypothetical protein
MVAMDVSAPLGRVETRQNVSTAKTSIAAEAARHDHKPNLPSRQRQIGETSLIPAMDPSTRPLKNLEIESFLILSPVVVGEERRG